MKWSALVIPALSLSLAACFHRSAENDPQVLKKEIATCYGYTPCNACRSCNYCKWCTAGGTCGICKELKKPAPKKYNSPTNSPGQCKAKTKKGTRCSRSSRSGGYCWQHGG